MKRIGLIFVIVVIALTTWLYWPTEQEPPTEGDGGYFTITNNSSEAIDIDIVAPTPTPAWDNLLPVFWVRYFESPEDYQDYKDKVATLFDEAIKDEGNELLPIADFGFGYIFGGVDSDWADNPSLFPLCVKLSAQLPEWYIPEFKALLGESLLKMDNEICRNCLNNDLAVFRYMWEEGLSEYEGRVER